MRKLLLGAAVVVFAAAGTQAAATAVPPLNRPLKSSQVACAARQLARVQRRMAAYGPGISLSGDGGLDPRGSILALSHTTLGGGVFTGLARIVDLGLSPCPDFHEGISRFTEKDLAFELLFKRRTDLLDPRHARIPQATLVRRDWGTNFGLDNALCPVTVRPELNCPTILSLDLAAREMDPLIPQEPIYLNSSSAEVPGLSGPGAIPRAAATGRGPGILNDDLSQACGGVLTDFDQRVFEILARSILPSDAFLTLTPPRSCDGVPLPFGFTLTIFRGTDPHVYRANIYLYEHGADDRLASDTANRPVIALEMKMNWDGAGRLTTGTARVLPPCKDGQDLDCTGISGGLGLVIVPPIFPGHEEEPASAFHKNTYLNFTGASSPANVLQVTVDWADLLRNTALNSP